MIRARAGAERNIRSVVENNVTKFVAMAIIYDPSSGVVLLQHRTKDAPISPDKWGLFGGHGEEGENPQQALVRELREEMGVEFQETDSRFIHDYQLTSALHRFVFLIDSFPSDSEVKINGEADEYAWVPLDKVFEYDLTDRVKIDFEKFLQCRSK